MGQFLRINGDYNIKAGDGATIKLDTGPGIGEVHITGNLVVDGDTVTVSAENLQVRDNVIGLNSGELGAGVSLRFSGLEIDRGSEQNAVLLFDENDNTWIFALGSGPTFSYGDSNIRIKGISTSSDTDDGDLTLIGSGTGVVKVAGTSNYEDQVTDDDDIPNKKYVDDTIQNNPTSQIVASNTKIFASDKDIAGTGPGTLAYFNTATGYSTFGESALSLLVDGILNTQFYPSRVEIQELELSGTDITTKAGVTNSNISIRTQGTGKLQTNYAIQIDQVPLTPAYVSGSTLLYSSSPSIGTTGLYYVNDSAEARLRNGELINKNKALLFSMIF